MPSLTVIKRVKSADFTTVNNKVLKDKSISLRAKGLLITVMGLPTNWDFSVQGIVSIVKESYDAIYSVLNELIAAGYVERKKCYEDGKISRWEYIFYEESGKVKENLLRGFPDVGSQDVGSQDVGFPAQLNKQLINETKAINKTKDIDIKLRENIQIIFEEWRKQTQRTESTRLTAERRDKIRARLKSFSVDELKKALIGVKNDPFYMGFNEMNKPYNDIITIFKNDSKVEELSTLLKSLLPHQYVWSHNN